MNKKTRTNLMYGGIIIAIILIAYFGAKNFSVSSTEGYLTLDSEGLYQFTGSSELYLDTAIYSGCTPGAPIWSEDPIKSDEVTIQTANYNYNIKVLNTNPVSTTSGYCGQTGKYNVEVYQNNILLDSFSINPSLTACSDAVPLKVEKDYSELNAVFGDSFSFASNDYCGTNLFLASKYKVVYPIDTITTQITLLNKNETGVSLKIAINNKYHNFEGRFYLKAVNSFGSDSTIYEKRISLPMGSSEIIVSLPITSNQLAVVKPYFNLYASNSRISNLNGVNWFENIKTTTNQFGTYPFVRQTFYNNFFVGEFIGDSFIINGNETESCSDGIQNQDELGIDCGGVCSSCTSPPTCSDSIKNGAETGVDCGGTCPACNIPPKPKINWELYGAIGAIVVLLGLGIFYFMRRK